MNKYPIYIVSKGRWENPITAKQFIKDGVDFKILVEPQEYENYCESIPERFVQKLPFSNLGLGSYPARNEAWKDSIINSHSKHWVFDDNICVFNKWQGGGRRKAPSVKHALLYVEAFSDSNNIDVSGFEKKTFSTRVPKRPFKTNCHVYSTLLIRVHLNKLTKYNFNLLKKYNKHFKISFSMNGDICWSVMFHRILWTASPV